MGERRLDPDLQSGRRRLTFGGEKRANRRQDFVLLGVSILLGALGAWILRQPTVIETGSLWWWIFFISACSWGGLAMLRMDAWLPEASALPRLWPAGEGLWRRRGKICLILAGILGAWLVVRLWPNFHQWHGTVLPWLVSLGLVLVGAHFLGKTDPRPAENSQTRQAMSRPDFPLPRRVELLGFLVIAALAVFLRVYNLDEFPPGIYVDETNAALDALYILEGNDVSPFATGWYETPNGYLYFMAGMLKLFGANWYTLKAISILPALLTVLAVYPLGRMMFGPAAGLAAMLFTAVSRWHLSMSRFGWNETAVPLFQIAATYFLLRGLRERRPLWFAIGGVISGLMVYTYLSSRLALATLGLFLVYWLAADPEGPRTSLKRHLPGMALFFFALVIAVAPIAVTYITNPFTFTNRVSEISIFADVKQAGNLEPLLLNIQDHLRFFHQIGDHQGKHNLPNEPEADPVTGALFVIGLIYAGTRLRDRRRGLLWLWLLLGMAGGVFSSNHESPQSYRTLTALPAVTLLAGDVLSRFLRAGWRAFPLGQTSPAAHKKVLWVRAAITALFILAMIAAAAWESSVFIKKQMTSAQVRAWFNPTEFAVGNEVVAALKADRTIYLSPNFYNYSPMRFLVYGYMKPAFGRNTLDDHPYRLVRPEDTLPISDSRQDAVFLLDMDYEPVAEYFLVFYPNAQIEVVQPEGYEPLYLRVTVPQADLSAVQGLLYTAMDVDGRQITGNVSSMTLPPADAALTEVGWRGSLRIERSGNYTLISSTGLSLEVDNQPWTGSRYLCGGLHPVTINWTTTSGELPHLQWAYNDQQPAPIPEEAWFKIAPPSMGLTGSYFSGVGWQGTPVCTQQTPFFMLAWPNGGPVAGAFSATYTGKLRVPVDGVYRLQVFADDGVRLTLDGNLMGESVYSEGDSRIEIQVELSAGDHPIRIDYYQAGGGSGLVFKWQTPGGKMTLVPTSALIP